MKKLKHKKSRNNNSTILKMSSYSVIRLFSFSVILLFSFSCSHDDIYQDEQFKNMVYLLIGTDNMFI